MRRYQYNPRLLEVARELPKGTIFDRNGIPLATSDWAQIEAHRADYEKLGVALDQTTSKLDRRHYPLGRADVLSARRRADPVETGRQQYGV